MHMTVSDGDERAGAAADAAAYQSAVHNSREQCRSKRYINNSKLLNTHVGKVLRNSSESEI
jgi:hypothetical protein